MWVFIGDNWGWVVVGFLFCMLVCFAIWTHKYLHDMPRRTRWMFGVFISMGVFAFSLLQHKKQMQSTFWGQKIYSVPQVLCPQLQVGQFYWLPEGGGHRMTRAVDLDSGQVGLQDVLSLDILLPSQIPSDVVLLTPPQ